MAIYLVTVVSMLVRAAMCVGGVCTGSVVRSAVAPAQLAVEVGASDAAPATAKPRDSVPHSGCLCASHQGRNQADGEGEGACWDVNSRQSWSCEPRLIACNACRRQSIDSDLSQYTRPGPLSRPQPLHQQRNSRVGWCAPSLVRSLTPVRGVEAWRATSARISALSNGAAALAAFLLPSFALVASW